MGSNTIGPKLKVDGESDFKSAISGINKDMNVLASEMKVVTATFGDNKDSMEALTAKGKILNEQVDKQKEKIAELKKALANSTEQYGENSNKTKDWQIKLNNAEAQLASLNSAVDENEKAMKDSGKETDNFKDKVKEVADESEKTSGKLSGLAKALGTGLAVAATTAATAFTAVVAGAVEMSKKLIEMADATASTGDNIDKMSQKLGLSREGYQEWNYVLSQSGANIDSMGAGMKKLKESIVDAQSGTESAIDKFDALGISLEDIKGKGTEEVFGIVVEKLQGMSDTTEKAAIGADLLGKSATELMPLLNGTAEATEALKKQAHDLGMVMSDDAVNGTVAYTDASDNLTRVMSNAKNEMVAVFLPGLADIKNGLAGLVTGQNEASEQLVSGVKKIVDGVSQNLPGVIDTFNSVLEDIAEIAPQVISTLVSGISDNLPKVIETAMTVIDTLVKSIADCLPEITESAILLVGTLVNGLIDNLPEIIQSGLDIIITLADSIGDSLPELIPTMVETVITICEIMLDNMDKIIDAAFKIIKGLAKGLIDALPKLIERLPQIINSFVRFFVDNMPKIIETGIYITVELAKGLIKAIPDLVKELPKIVSSIIEGIGKAATDIIPIGKNIVEGLWHGILNAKDWLLDKIKGFANSVINGIKGFFGINSPSTVMRDQVGKYMAEGIGVGFVDEMENVANDMENSIPTSFDIDANINAKGKSALSTSDGIDRIIGLLSIIAGKDTDIYMDGTKISMKVSDIIGMKIA